MIFLESKWLLNNGSENLLKGALVATFGLIRLQILRKFLKRLGHDSQSPDNIRTWDFLAVKQGCRLLNLDTRFYVQHLCACDYTRPVTHSSPRDPSRLSVLSICHAAVNVTVGLQLYDEWPVHEVKVQAYNVDL